MRRYYPLNELFLSRMRLFFREPETIFWVYCFPLILMVSLGIAFRDTGDPTVWVRVAATTKSQLDQLSSALRAQEHFRVEEATLEDAEARPAPERWDITVIGKDGRLEYHYDPDRGNSRTARLWVNRVLQEASGRVDPIEAQTKHQGTPGGRYIEWLIPGLMGLNIMGGGLWGVGFVAVDMRIRKLLKRFRAAPMRRSHFLLSLMGGRLLFLLPEMTVILVAGYLTFGLRIQGSLWSVAIVATIGAASFAGLGLLIACRAQKLETISGLMNLAMLPMWMLSGVFFSSERFPDSMQPFVQALPLTQLNHALRGVILSGESVVDVGSHLLIVMLWGGLSFPLALRWFRWQ